MQPQRPQLLPGSHQPSQLLEHSIYLLVWPVLMPELELMPLPQPRLVLMPELQLELVPELEPEHQLVLGPGLEPEPEPVLEPEPLPRPGLMPEPMPQLELVLKLRPPPLLVVQPMLEPALVVQPVAEPQPVERQRHQEQLAGLGLGRLRPVAHLGPELELLAHQQLGQLVVARHHHRAFDLSGATILNSIPAARPQFIVEKESFEASFAHQFTSLIWI